jgi:hypothetical protein
MGQKKIRPACVGKKTQVKVSLSILDGTTGLEKLCALRFTSFRHVRQYCPWQQNSNDIMLHLCGRNCAAGREKMLQAS